MILKKLTNKLFIILILVLLGMAFLSFSNKINADEINYPTCYQQNDPRWGSHMNGDGSIASSACGLLSVTNSVNYLTGNFINPIELADYAYSIHAYNIPEGGGTWRDLFYHRLKDYEERYGFKVVKSSIYADVNDQRLRNHLMTGGVSICHVYGHFIAVVGYDKDNDSYLVYDSAASSRRHTIAAATWLTSKQLSEDLMKIDWFCLISKTRDHDSKYYGDINKSNGKAEVEYTISNQDESKLIISGYANSTDPIKKYYYNICPLSSYEYEYFNNHYSLDYVHNIEKGYDGFKGLIDTSALKSGTYYCYVYGQDTKDHLINVAQIKLSINQNSVDELALSDSTININQTIEKDESLFIGNLDLSNVKYLEIETSNYVGSLNLQNKETFNCALINQASLNSSNNNSVDSVIVNVNQLNYIGPLYLFNNTDSDISINKIIVRSGEQDVYLKEMTNNEHQRLLGYKDGNPIYETEDHHVINDKLDATCLTDGYDKQFCSICNHQIKDEVLEHKGHIAEEYSYNDDGHFFICDVCYEIYGNETHQYEIRIAKSRHYKYCTICGYQYDFEYHFFDEHTHLCTICGTEDPNKPIENNELENNETTENAENTTKEDASVVNETPTKKGCKKNSILEIIGLTSLISLVYLFTKKH